MTIIQNIAIHTGLVWKAGSRWFLITLLVLSPTALLAQTAPAKSPPAPAKSPSAPATPEGMVFVPGGEFTMGTNFEDPPNFNLRQYIDAQPEHVVTVAPFFIDRTEVTNAAYKKYCDATRYPPPPHWENGKYAEGEAAFPVTHVNWWEATAYAAWAGKRLPTEAEWEKAARGTDKRKYPWGDVWNEAFVILGKEKPKAVALKPEGASPFGAMDMAGNVQEWVQDWYDAYPGSRHKLPEFGKQQKVTRGGFFWTGGAQLVCLSFYRSMTRPETRSSVTGFRCARDAK